MVSPVSAGGGFTRTGVCIIVDMSSLEIEVDVNESHINRISPAQCVVHPRPQPSEGGRWNRGTTETGVRLLPMSPPIGSLAG